MRTSALLGLLTCCLIVGVQSGCSRPTSASPLADAKAAQSLRDTLKAGGGEAAAGAADTADASEAKGWADLKVTFKLAGTAPTPSKVPNITAECSTHNIVDESVVVGPDNALENVVLFARTPKLPVNPEYEASAGQEVVLDNKNCRFEPHVAVLRTSQSLMVKNSDAFGHNTKIDPQANAPSNAILAAGGTAPQKYAKEEPLPVKVGCNIHPWMGAWLVVRNDPYAGASDKKGEIVLKNVPAGKEIEFQLWQEKSGFLKSAEIKGVDGVKVDGKGRFKLKLEDGKPLDLTINVPADALK